MKPKHVVLSAKNSQRPVRAPVNRLPILQAHQVELQVMLPAIALVLRLILLLVLLLVLPLLRHL